MGDKVLVTAGKDKGKTSEITKVFPKELKILVKDINIYTKNVKPVGDRAGETVRRERPMDVSKVAIINDKGQRDRVGYKVRADGTRSDLSKDR
jgi:large subunit ribosomal protein L24